MPRLGLARAPAPAPATVPPDEGDEEEDYEESEYLEPERDLSFLSPIRLRMGWRQNGELEKKTAKLTHMLDMLGPVSETLVSRIRGEIPGGKKQAKAGIKVQVDETVKRFESQQARLEMLERELEASRQSGHQAITSRAEMVKRVEEERARSNQLTVQLEETKSRLARAQRQIELLKNPGQQPAEDSDPDKPRPMHERVQQQVQKKAEKLAAIRSAAEGDRTYAPAIDPSSAKIAKTSANRPKPVASGDTPAAEPTSLRAAAKAAEAKADQVDSASASAQELAALSAKERDMLKDLRAQMNKDQLELSTERRLREAAEAAAAKALAAEKFAQERRAEIEMTLQKMTTKERDQTVEFSKHSKWPRKRSRSWTRRRGLQNLRKLMRRPRPRKRWSLNANALSGG